MSSKRRDLAAAFLVVAFAAPRAASAADEETVPSPGEAEPESVISTSPVVETNEAATANEPDASMAAAAREQLDVEETAEANRLRGTAVGISNSVSVMSFAPDAEPDYNPRFVTGFYLAPRWSFDDTFYAHARIGFATELTQADWTNDRFFLDDLSIGGGASSFVEIPWVEVPVSAGHTWRFATSKASRGETLLAATTLSASAKRTFPVLEGLSIGLATVFGKSFHRYATGSLSHRILGVCQLGIDDRCAESVAGYGVRNVSWSLGAKLSASIQILDWISASLAAGLQRAQLYALTADDERISNAIDDPTSSRHYITGTARVSVAPLDFLSCTLGMSTMNQELAPDGSHRTPFFNRYTSIYVDVELGLDHFLQL